MVNHMSSALPKSSLHLGGLFLRFYIESYPSNVFQEGRTHGATSSLKIAPIYGRSVCFRSDFCVKRKTYIRTADLITF